jgi:hypothetical protein
MMVSGGSGLPAASLSNLSNCAMRSAFIGSSRRRNTASISACFEPKW